MKQYIDKSVIIAEIERLKECNRQICGGDFDFLKKAYPERYYSNEIYDNILSFINTLEIKEVDLEKEYKDFVEEDPVYNKLVNGIVGKAIAKHFFELGLSVNNPITAADRGTAEEIIVNLKRVEQDYYIDLTREIEWLRNKVKKEK